MNFKKRHYKNIHQTTTREGYSTGKFFCWVHEQGGYFAYCHKDGRLITRTGCGQIKNIEQTRTWSSVGQEVIKRSLYKCILK